MPVFFVVLPACVIEPTSAAPFCRALKQSAMLTKAITLRASSVIVMIAGIRPLHPDRLSDQHTGSCSRALKGMDAFPFRVRCSSYELAYFPFSTLISLAWPPDRPSATASEGPAIEALAEVFA